MHNKAKLTLTITAVIIFFITALIFLNKPRFELPETEINEKPAGISFKGIGKNTKLSQQLIKDLEKSFGNSVVQAWPQLEIQDFSDEFYQQNLGELQTLRAILTAPENEEITAGKIIKIKFPYVEKSQRDLNFLEMIFSIEKRVPLIIRRDYRPGVFPAPDSIKVENKTAIITTIKKDRFDKDYNRTIIYFNSNLTGFIKALNIDPK